MKHIVKALALASVMAMSSTAQAEVASATLVAGGPAVKAFGYEMSKLRGSGTLSFSADLVGALQVAGIQTAAVAPATVNVGSTEDGDTISANAPVNSLSGTFDSDTAEFTATHVATLGGATLVADKKNFSTTKGSLSLTGITVDLGAKAIYADLVGGNGVGVVEDVHVWTFSKIEGPTTFAAVNGTTVANNKLTGLAITEEAFNLFATSLGLTKPGIAAMREIADYGAMDAQIMVDVKTVPEPSTYALMGVGLVGMALASKRARRGQ